MYFAEICTTANQPNFAEAASKHRRALNNYLTYGTATDEPNYPYNKKGEQIAQPSVVKKVVKHQTTVQTLQENTGIIYTTTFLCCEDEK